jgi:hemolysin activation/secretion protein
MFFIGLAGFVLALAFFFAPRPAEAQTPPIPNVPDSGSIMRDTRESRPTPPARREAPELGQGAVEETQLDVSSTETIFVRDFLVEDAVFVSEGDIRAVLEPYKGRDLTMGQIQEAVGRVTELYRRAGYPVARAYLPRQSIENGVIVIRVLIGKYGSTNIENDSLVRDFLISSTIDANLTQGEPVRGKDLERSVLLIGDMPGAGLPTLSMGPGQEQGATDFSVQVPRGKRFGAFFSLDNWGSRYTGRWRLGAGLEVNSPLGLADRLMVYGLTTDAAGLMSVAAYYGFPIGGRGLRLELGYSHVAYKLGEEFEALEASGWANTFEANLSYPLIRSASHNLYLGLGFAHKDTHDEYKAVDFSEKSQSDVGNLSVRYEAWGHVFGRPIFAAAGAGLVFGNLRIPEEQKPFARGTEGGFSYVTLDLMANLAITDDFLFIFTASAQKALGQNLDSSEQFNVTGAYGVKAYREAISGDNGYLIGAEFRHRLPWFGGYKLEHYLGVFGDVGGWSYERAPFPAKRSDTLYDVGLSYSLSFGPVALQARLAKGLGRYPSELRPEHRTIGTVLVTAAF